MVSPAPRSPARPGLAARGGSYVGTRGHFRGEPAAMPYPPAALRPDPAARLWRLSEQLTGVG